MTPDPVPRGLRVASELAWRSLIVAAAILLLALLAARLRIVILPVVVAILLATALTPLVAAIGRRGAPRSIAALLALVAFLAVVGGAVAVVVPPVAAEIGEVDVGVESGLERATSWFADGPFGLSEAQVERWRDRGVTELRAQGRRIAGGLLGGAYLMLELVAGVLLTLVLLFFFLKDGARLWASVVGLFPRRAHADADAIGRLAWETLTGYFRGVFAVALVDAVFIGLALLVLGVPLVLPLALLTFVGGFFPIVGAVAAGVVATLVALALEGTTTALLVLLAVILVQQLESNLLQPFLVGRAVRLHPVVVLVSVAVGAVLWGVAGAFIGPPLAAVVARAGGHLRGRERGVRSAA